MAVSGPEVVHETSRPGPWRACQLGQGHGPSNPRRGGMDMTQQHPKSKQMRLKEGSSESHAGRAKEEEAPQFARCPAAPSPEAQRKMTSCLGTAEGDRGSPIENTDCLALGHTWRERNKPTSTNCGSKTLAQYQRGPKYDAKRPNGIRQQRSKMPSPLSAREPSRSHMAV